MTVSLRNRSGQEKLLPYRPKPPVRIKVGVQKLYLICPQEDIKSQLETISEVIPLSDVRTETDTSTVSETDSKIRDENEVGKYT